MTREEKQKAIDALKISVPIMAVTQEEFNDYIRTLNKVMDWLDQEPTTKNDLSSELDKNSKELEKDFGELDCIDRAELLKAMDTWDKFGDDPNKGLIVLSTPALQDRYVPYVKYDNMVKCVKNMSSVTSQEPILDKINKMKSEIADSLEFWDYSPNNNPLARDMLETLTNFWGDMKEDKE